MQFRGFQDIKETVQVGFDVGSWILNGIADTGLGSKVDNNGRVELREDLC